MKIWITMRGEYEEKWVCGVFSSKEKAEEYIRIFNETNPPSPFAAARGLDDRDSPYIVNELELDKPIGLSV